MKVLQVIDSGGLYGAERVLLTLIEQLGRVDVECRLASIGEPGLPDKPLETEARRRGVDVRRQTMAAGPDWRAARTLVAAAREEGFDLIHTHGYKANSLIAGQSRARRRLPVVATLHGWTATRRCSRVGSYETVERFALRRADRVVAVSETMVQRWGLRRRYGRRLTVIPNGAAIASCGSANADLPAGMRAFIADRQSIFAAGRLSLEKGFDVLIDALAELRTTGIDVCLVVAGEGDERAALERRIRDLGLGEAVLMPGYLAEAGRFMRHFDVLAIPSRSEGLPLVLLEALVAGVPVAATAVGDMSAVLSSCDAGHCAIPGDVVSLAERLQALLAGPRDEIQLGRIAERAARRYSAGSMASAYKTVYEEQLSQR